MENTPSRKWPSHVHNCFLCHSKIGSLPKQKRTLDIKGEAIYIQHVLLGTKLNGAGLMWTFILKSILYASFAHNKLTNLGSLQSHDSLLFGTLE